MSRNTKAMSLVSITVAWCEILPVCLQRAYTYLIQIRKFFFNISIVEFIITLLNRRIYKNVVQIRQNILFEKCGKNVHNMYKNHCKL